MHEKIGVLLANLGSPDACTTKAVYRYLTEFLNDPRVIDLPKIKRWLLTNVIIVPFRSKRSAQAYQQIWTENGSPLLVNGKKLAAGVQAFLGEKFQVELGMRYGNPSIPQSAEKLMGCKKIIFMPLFPQYTSAATGSAIEAFTKATASRWNIPSFSVIEEFYKDPGFIRAYASRIQQTIKDQIYDLLLFSYHGLPERHIHKSECFSQCDHIQACPKMTSTNRHCYRAQCFATTSLIAKELGLSKEQFAVSFQSRLGRTPWIKPYSDVLLPELVKNEVKNLAVVCPSFVADCLETLEEVNIRMRRQWQTLGGESFIFIPCLNSEKEWVESLAQIVQHNISKDAL